MQAGRREERGLNRFLRSHLGDWGQGGEAVLPFAELENIQGASLGHTERRKRPNGVVRWETGNVGDESEQSMGRECRCALSDLE